MLKIGTNTPKNSLIQVPAHDCASLLIIPGLLFILNSAAKNKDYQ
jgi:hypothetical protein